MNAPGATAQEGTTPPLSSSNEIAVNLKMPAHDKEMAGRFLTILDPNATRFSFQFFSDDKAKKYGDVFHGTIDEVWPKVLALNTAQQHVGAFVTINETDGKGRKAENIVRPRALFVDADSDEQTARCANSVESMR